MRIFLFLFFVSITGVAQDLYNFDNSLTYARHLKTSRIYKGAISEYERLLFMQPSNTDIIKELVFCYKKSDQFGKTISLLDTLKNRDKELTFELVSAHFIERNYDKVLALAISEQDQDVLPFIPATIALNNDHKKSISLTDSLLHHHNNVKLIMLKSETESYLKKKNKSPYVAASLSIIPGLGKVYTKNYSDAVLSFLMTGGLVFQTYRGFSKNGVKSAYGWIYGGLALGFYSGNIYGAWKAAKKFNQKKNDAYDAKIRAILLSDN